MHPLFKLVAFTLLTAHPDKYKKVLSLAAGSNTAPPCGISMVQLIRAVEQRGQELLRDILSRDDQAQKKRASSATTKQQQGGGKNVGSDAAATTTSSSNSKQQQQRTSSSSSMFDADDDDDELMNADQALVEDDDSEDGADDQQQQGNNDAVVIHNKVRAIWPSNRAVEEWVPEIVQQLISMGAIVDENQGIENRRPHLRLTQAAFSAAWHELSGQRAEKGASNILPTEVKRRSNKNKTKREKKRRQSAKKAKRQSDAGARMAKKVDRVKSKMLEVRRNKKKGTKRR